MSLTPDYLARQAKQAYTPGAIEANRVYMTKHWRELHGIPIASLKRSQVAGALNRLSERHGQVAGNKARSTLRGFFNWAISQGHCEVNPVEGTELNPTKSRDRVLEPEELHRIWENLQYDCFGGISRLLILTGCRRDEIAGLIGSEVNRTDFQIELPPERTKNRKPFIVPLCTMARPFVPTEKEGLLFTVPGGKKHTGWASAKAKLDRACGVTDWTQHDYRRTMSTVMNGDLKIQPHIVEACLNHVTKGVAGVYIRATYLDEKREAMDRYGEWLRKVVKE